MIALRPSSSSTWTQCAAQPRLAANMPPEEPSDPAREGTCAAWLAELVLTGQVADCHAGVGMIHENGWVVDAPMAFHIQKYVDQVRSHGGTIHTERRVTLNPMIAGTPDAFAVVDTTGTLHVDDLKYGFGIVEPERNTQVSIYGGAILRMLTARGVIVRLVKISIYQPRAWHPLGVYRTWTLRPEQLMEFVQWIEARGQDCQDPNAPARPGEHCKHCEAQTTCAANAWSLYAAFDAVSVQVQRHMTGPEVARELDFLDRIEKMIEGRRAAIEAEAEARLKQNDHIPGWHMEPRMGNRRFTMSPAQIRMIAGFDVSKPGIMTPDEAERAGMNPDFIKMLTERPTLKPKLKRVPDGFYRKLFPQVQT